MNPSSSISGSSSMWNSRLISCGFRGFISHGPSLISTPTLMCELHHTVTITFSAREGVGEGMREPICPKLLVHRLVTIWAIKKKM